ncbi:hypothetical protein K466DRAFT_590593 [Polyporus arcularius HHB13444]|uniref:Uncharacterized protein n=1 Tax=Polyporus arcularius HHB13444 TaxID=1314778 RepID=A0A5C3NY20_9APHY|nr:hypothetical protein K466DRAFT_590593 [Polyporus arcularius HHB13444]
MCHASNKQMCLVPAMTVATTAFGGPTDVGTSGRARKQCGKMCSTSHVRLMFVRWTQILWKPAQRQLYLSGQEQPEWILWRGYAATRVFPCQWIPARL